jgi:hypothetical protein
VTRYASSTNQTEGAKPAIVQFTAAELNFASGFVRAHNGLGTINFGGNDYVGVGTLGGLEFDEESTQLQGRGFTLTVSAESSLVATARDEIYQGRSAKVYLGFLNIDTGVVLDTPELVEDGIMDQMRLKLGPNSGIQILCESLLRSPVLPARYTDADQNLRYPGDRFFDLAGKIAGFPGTWGAGGVANDLSGYQAPAVTGPYHRGNMPGRNP